MGWGENGVQKNFRDFLVPILFHNCFDYLLQFFLLLWFEEGKEGKKIYNPKVLLLLCFENKYEYQKIRLSTHEA